MYVLIGVSCILFTKFNVVPKIPGISIGAQYLISGIAWIVLNVVVDSFADQGAVILSSITIIMSVVAEAAFFGLLLSTSTGIGGTTLIVMAVLFYMGSDIIIVTLNTIKSGLEAATWMVVLTCLVFGTLVLCYFGLHAGMYYTSLCVLCELLSIRYLHGCVSKVYGGTYQALSNSSYKLSTIVCGILAEVPDLWIALIWLPFMFIPMVKDRFG